jgi:hypothetical protein
LRKGGFSPCFYRRTKQQPETGCAAASGNRQIHQKRPKDEKINTSLIRGTVIETNTIKNCIIKSQQMAHENMVKGRIHAVQIAGMTEKSVTRKAISFFLILFSESS